MGCLERAIKKGAVAVQVYRFSGGGFDANGRALPETEAEVQIDMWIQPSTGDDLQRLPEGLRTQEVVKAYALEELRAGDLSEGQKPDELEIDGVRWQVEQVWDWNDGSWSMRNGSYWKALAIRKGQ